MLRHSSDSEPGYTRQRMGEKWAYFDGDTRVTDRDEIDRLNGLALPPAYIDAWFCKSANGHIQATGTDATKDVMVDKAKVVKTDIQTSNGVIHVIDELLMPPTH